MSKFCVRCNCDLRRADSTGEPAIFQSADAWTLCEPCFFAEDAEIEQRGGNDLPDVRERYARNYHLHG